MTDTIELSNDEQTFTLSTVHLGLLDAGLWGAPEDDPASVGLIEMGMATRQEEASPGMFTFVRTVRGDWALAMARTKLSLQKESE